MESGNSNEDFCSYEINCESSSWLEDATNIFNTFGFVILKNSIPKLQIQDLHSKLLILIESDQISNNVRDIHFFSDGVVSSAHNLCDYLHAYSELAKINYIEKFIKNVYGDISDSHFNSSYFAKPKFQGMETKPHQDNAFFCMEPANVATCWIPITFANRSNGGLYYYPKSFNIGNIEHLPQGNLGASMCIPDSTINTIAKIYPKEYIALELGDCVIHNALTIHGSDANCSEFDRNAFNFSFASENAVRNEYLFASYKNKLDAFLQRKK